MFTLYHSNQLELLKSLTVALMQRDPLDSPLTAEIILVQSKGMTQWLQQEIAKETGIAANIDFQLPGRFIWSMVTRLITEPIQDNVFTHEAMLWKLLAILPQHLADPALSKIHDYLNSGESQLKQFQFTDKLARLFEHYMMYRPDWITQWSKGLLVDKLSEHQSWQARLWQALLDYSVSIGQLPQHRVSLYQQLLFLLQQGQCDQALLPKRIFIVGINALPPIYLTLLHALGQYCDVHLMLTNPCRFYWGEIQDPRWLAKIALQTRHHYQQKKSIAMVKDLAQPLTHPLLASWGKQGRDTLYLLQELEPKQDIDAFVDLKSTSLLTYLQQGILELDGDIPDTKYTITEHDHSVQIHCCHSILREVEVLHDQLLALFDDNHQLQASDIIVMVPDIDAYTPYIQAIFGQKHHDSLPFTVSDRKVKEMDPIVQTFLSLLTLPKQRYTTEEIFTLLELPAIAKKFNFDDVSLATIKQWIMQSGIRWGLNDQQIEEIKLPATGKNSWQFGLERMLLGYSMHSQQGDWHDVLPFDETRGLIAERVGYLAEFIHRLNQWRMQLSEIRTLDQWAPLLKQLMDDFFVHDPLSAPSLLFIESAWQQVIKTGKESAYTTSITFEYLQMMLQSQLEQSYMQLNFLSGKITFCTLMPMRSIPFKIVCLLGMNDGDYPRVQIDTDFDLIAAHPRRGDRTRREDDRYLFLEALLAAEQRLYLSYIGYSIQDNSIRFPSLLITELVDFITARVCLQADMEKETAQQVEALTAHLFIKQTRVPFDATNFIANTPNQSYAAQWLPAANAQKTQHLPSSVILSDYPVVDITLYDLKQFYRHSCRYFFEKRLQVDFRLPEDILYEDEPFNVKGLSRYHVNSALLQHLLDGKSSELFWQTQELAGQLPFGRFAEQVIESSEHDIALLFKTLYPLYQPNTLPIDVELKIDNSLLQGQLKQYQTDGILRWRTGRLSIYDGFSLWIDHLIACTISDPKPSHLYGSDKTHWHFIAIEKEIAIEQLTQLVAGYKQGLCSPLCLPLKTAWEWLLTAQAEDNDEKLQQSWLQEQDEYYLRLQMDHLPLMVIKKNAIHYLTVLLQHYEKAK